MHERRSVVFSGGGTGGHLYPALAVADALRRLRPEVDVVFIGAERGIEGPILEERGERHVLLPVRGIDRGNPLGSLRGVGGLVRSLARTRSLFRTLRPGVVVVTGGYAGAPAGLVAALERVPLVLQEQNAVPGLVTRMLARRAARVHVAFPEAAARLPGRADRVRLTGNPVRPPAALGRIEARARLDLPPDAVVLLVVGGSQGSLPLNERMAAAVRAVARGELARPDRLVVLWATGPRHFESVSSATGSGESAWVRLVPYISDMPVALAAADLAVGRAGAMFTAELLNQGLPSVLMPLPSAAADHQTRNAESLAAAGAALTRPQSEMSAEVLWSLVVELASSPNRLERMRRAALALARPNATDEIAASVVEFLEQGAR